MAIELAMVLTRLPRLIAFCRCSGDKCEYRMVVEILRWPRISLTDTISTPAATRRDATVCRSVCQHTPMMPAFRNTGSNARRRNARESIGLSACTTPGKIQADRRNESKDRRILFASSDRGTYRVFPPLGKGRVRRPCSKSTWSHRRRNCSSRLKAVSMASATSGQSCVCNTP
jgi:hypothetical protein